ncbi:protein translocase subunit secB [Litoreibacter ponti]|uniref:Protein-export protein SecB n=1 Tax=Litoreibacter ponti TaxID=1510457 RepID=A0A2T6BPH8_9RHOB|nr:protein-export chaperone SecB [Litoreibacter ponti]PTX57877.1 protein translocase subunit secB [Litoreibacter ponti]
MAEENGAAAATPAQPRMQVLAQFIKDMSFENIAAQKGLGEGDQTPDIQVQVNLDARKRTNENQYDVTTKLEVNAKTKSDGKPIFLMELEYTGVFLVENVPDEQLHPFLMIECPRMLFPFLRRIVSDVTRDGGFPPLNLETIDFLALYRNELARRAQAEGKTPTADA